MKTAENEAVQQYLTAVGREASALPSDRRQELLADLAEHIDVTLAERQAYDEEAVRHVLRELGDPRTIAATALGESAAAGQKVDPGHQAAPSAPAPAPARPSARAGIPAWIAVVLLAVATPVGLAAPALLAGLARIAGVVMLWVTPRWTTAQKVLATVVTVAVITVPNVIMAAVDPAGSMPWTVLHTVQVVVPLALSAWLWVARRRA